MQPLIERPGPVHPYEPGTWGPREARNSLTPWGVCSWIDHGGFARGPPQGRGRDCREQQGPTSCWKLGFESLRPGQREAVEAALDGCDSLIVMPTGGGKSLCYQLPGLATEDLTIVVSPLIALMNDQWLRLTAAGHPVAMIASGMSEEATRGALDQVRGGEARIVYCSPERFGSSVFLDAARRSGASTCSPSTRRTASPSGGTTSGPTTCACRRSPSGSAGRR